MTEETRPSSDSSSRKDRRSASVAEALALLPGARGERFAKVIEHGSLLVEIYAPRGSDPQQPHTRDEVYVVVEGSGDFVNGDRRHTFAPGDLLFVPAGVTHRFEHFTEDLVVWVIFYGPEGGEEERMKDEGIGGLIHRLIGSMNQPLDCILHPSAFIPCSSSPPRCR